MNEERPETRKRTLKIVLIALAAVLLAGVLAAAFFMDYLRGHQSRRHHSLYCPQQGFYD